MKTGRYLAIILTAVVLAASVLPMSVHDGLAAASGTDGESNGFISPVDRIYGDDPSYSDSIRISDGYELALIGSGLPVPGMDGRYYSMDETYLQTADIIVSEDHNGGVTMTIWMDWEYDDPVARDSGTVTATLKYGTHAVRVSVSTAYIDRESAATYADEATAHMAYGSMPSGIEILFGGVAADVPGDGMETAFMVSYRGAFLPGTGVVTDSNGNMDPIGTEDDPFVGSYDGNWYTISGIAVSVFSDYSVDREMWGTAHAGLFGYVGTGAEIKNTGVLGGTVAASGMRVAAAALVGTADTVHVTNCYAVCDVAAIGYTKRLDQISSISSEYMETGGLVGSAVGDAEVRDSYHIGDVEASGASSTVAGGITGMHWSTVTISGCHSIGDIRAYGGYGTAGGLAGGSGSVAVRDSYHIGDVSGAGSTSGYAGGLVGTCSEADIAECYAIGTIRSYGSQSHGYSGGLVGNVNGGTCTVRDSHFEGDVHAYGRSAGYSGGIAGSAWDTVIENAYYNGMLTGSSKGGAVGHLIRGITTVNLYFLCDGAVNADVEVCGSVDGGVDPGDIRIFTDGSAGVGTSGRMTAEMMKDPGNFYDGLTDTGANTVEGWDFGEWFADASGNVNGGFPYLRQFFMVAMPPLDIYSDTAEGNTFRVIGNMVSAYQWQRSVSGGWDDIPGATGDTYVTTADDGFGDRFRCVVSSAADGQEDIVSDSARLYNGNASVSVDVSGNGDVSYRGTPVRDGERVKVPGSRDVTLSVTADQGWEIKSVIRDGADITPDADDGTIELTDIADDVLIVIVFGKSPSSSGEGTDRTSLLWLIVAIMTAMAAAGIYLRGRRQ